MSEEDFFQIISKVMFGPYATPYVWIKTLSAVSNPFCSTIKGKNSRVFTNSKWYISSNISIHIMYTLYNVIKILILSTNRLYSKRASRVYFEQRPRAACAWDAISGWDVVSGRTDVTETQWYNIYLYQRKQDFIYNIP